jgi:hypothetical protein
MASPKLTREQVTLISGMVAQYIAEQRQKYLPLAHPLNPGQREAMDGFFSDELLNSVNVLVLTDETIENPPFYSMAAAMGFANLPDFSLMGAITYCDIVVSQVPLDHQLLFHELVHTEQYHQLGIPLFAELYVRGYINGNGYDGIPLEKLAYELEDKFHIQPEAIFSVRQVVQEWIRDNAF